jgi:hypothetical protein
MKKTLKKLLAKMREWVEGGPGRQPRPRPFRPAVEALDSRIMPAITYHGGPVLSHVDVHNVFYGQGWKSADPFGVLGGSLNKFQADIAKSPYLAMLGEYGVGRGTTEQFNSSDLVTYSSSPAAGTTASPTLVKESQIQSMLITEILLHRLPRETGQQLYFVYLPPNVKSQWDQKSSFNLTGTFGHHGSFYVPGLVGNTPVYYAVIQDPSVTPTIPGLNKFQQLTEVSSHELAEAVTDPDVRQSDAGPQGGGRSAWWDSDQVIPGPWGISWVPNPNYGNEIGDVVNLQFADFVANGQTYKVQKEWSNYFGKGIVANGNRAGMLDVPTSGLPAALNFSYVTSNTWNNGGRTTSYYYATGNDGRTYLNFVTAAGDLSGWFTIDP